MMKQETTTQLKQYLQPVAPITSNLTGYLSDSSDEEELAAFLNLSQEKLRSAQNHGLKSQNIQKKREVKSNFKVSQVKFSKDGLTYVYLDNS